MSCGGGVGGSNDAAAADAQERTERRGEEAISHYHGDHFNAKIATWPQWRERGGIIVKCIIVGFPPFPIFGQTTPPRRECGRLQVEATLIS